MRAALASGVRAATDVTGFGLLGHLGNVLAASHLAAELYLWRTPVLSGARELAAAGYIPGGTQRNLAASTARWEPEIETADRVLLADAQTSGGLLLAVHPDRCDALLERLAEERAPAAAVIGRCVEGSPGDISVRTAP
jgi:selenide,water dikinase